MGVLLEVCVDTLSDVAVATELGADRIELCAALSEGGLTPSAGAVCMACTTHRNTVVLVRPRAGDFVYDEQDRAAMLGDVQFALANGARGVAIGAVTEGREVDIELTRELVEMADGVPVTFHRAFDAVEDPERALAVLAELGVRRVLTSGGASRAFDGAARLAALAPVASAAGIALIAGGGVRSDHVVDLVERTGLTEVHSSARQPVVSGTGLAAMAGTIDQDELRALRRLLG